jgi:hypothetical protein
MSLEDIKSDNGFSVEPPAPPEPPPAAPSAAGKLLANKGNLLLAGLFAGGIFLVYLLSLRGGPSTANAEQQQVELQVETALSQFSANGRKEESRKAREVVGSFYREARQRQVPIKQLSGNPFVYKSPGPAEAAPVKAQPAQEETIAARNLGEALDAARQLVLQSVLTGEHGNTAMISNNLLTEGQTLGDWTVSKIEPRRVVLTFRGQEFVLRMHN